MGKDGKRRLVRRRGLGEYCGCHHPRAVVAAIGDSRSSRRVDHHDHNFHHDDHYGSFFHDDHNHSLHDHHCALFHDDHNHSLHDHHCALFHDDHHCAVFNHNNHSAFHDDHNGSLHDHHDDPVSRSRY